MITGGCHCSNIRFRLESAKTPSEFAPRVCDCTFCTKHGARYISDPEGSLRIEIEDSALVERYAFGHRTAEFMVCRRCGAVPAIVSEIDGTTHGVVNINTADNPEAFTTPATVVGYDGEEVDRRLARRQRNWIGTVVIVCG